MRVVSAGDFESEEFSVFWNEDECIHCGLCAQGLPKVFSLKDQLSINLRGASEEHIIAQIGECPSGALTYWRK